MRTLLGHHFVKHRTALLLVVVGLAGFHFIITRIAPSPEETQRFGAMLSFLPSTILQAVGLSDAMLVTTRGVIAFGYVHPFTILLLGLWTVRVTASGLAGEIGEGTMDLLATRPVSRPMLVASVALTAAAGIVAAAAAAWTGTAIGVSTRTLGNVAPGDFVWAAASLALLFAGWAGFALAVSALRPRGGSAIGIVAGVMAVTFALDYVGRMYAPLRGVRWISPFTYFAPHQMRGMALDSTGIVVLGGLALGGLAVALLVFRRRDL